jgi:hypothetical protein
MSARKYTLLAFACFSAVVVSSADAAVIYDLGNFPFAGVGFTDVEATLETAVTGVFSSEADIENFFNASPYVIRVSDGSIVRFELTNDNSNWDLQIAGIGSEAVLTITPTLITLAFFTPEEISGGTLLLRNPATFDNWQYTQSNNVSDVNFVAFSTGNIVDADGGARFPFGRAFVFPVSNGVPEPSTFLMLGVALINVLRRLR